MLAEKCALTSLALGPVYVNTPVLLLYASEPSPPASVTDTNALTPAESISGLDIENSPVPLLYTKSPPAEKCALTSDALGPVYVNCPDALS